MKKKVIFSITGLAVLAGCATYVAPTKEESVQAVKSSFKERGPAKLDRLNQTEIQAVCSDAQIMGKEVPKAEAEADAGDPKALRSEIQTLVIREFGLAVHDVQVVSRIPKTTSGKIVRHLCRQMYVDGE